MIKSFSKGTSEKLGYYVYRLIDPRNGQTFYVGKGKENRVFDHVKDALKKKRGGSDKIKTIKDIHNEGLEVVTLIHRHGMTEDQAKEVEAALIDVYGGLTNIQRGINSDHGVANILQLEKRYSLPVAELRSGDQMLIIKLRQETVDSFDGNVYNAVRRIWRLSIDSAKKCTCVLAVVNGIIKGAYKVNEWMKESDGRLAFDGCEADQDVKDFYCGKQIPSELIKKGCSNPTLYWPKLSDRIAEEAESELDD